MKKKNKKVIVNLGCGPTRIPGSIGVDVVKIKGFVDKVHNLDKTPYPFKSNSVDEVHMYHVLEHLHDPLKKVEDVYRILKKDGLFYIRVPHFSSQGAFTDITHVRPFGYTSFECFFEGNVHNFYTKARFKPVERELKYFGLYPNSGAYAKYIHPNECFWLFKPVVRVLNFLMNLSPTLFERVWCYWIGGAGELVVTLQKK